MSYSSLIILHGGFSGPHVSETVLHLSFMQQEKNITGRHKKHIQSQLEDAGLL